MKNKYKNLIKDTFVFAIGGIGSKIILFLLVPLYTNFLSTEEYGIADLVFTISQFLIPVFGMVIWDAVVRFALSRSEKKENVLLCSLVVWAISAAATIAFTPLLGLYEPISEWKWYLCIYVIINILTSIELNYIKAKEQNKLYSIISIVQTLSMALSNILFIVVVPMGVSGYVSANIIGVSASAIGIFIFGKIYKDIKNAHFSSELLKRMLAFSAPLILNNLSWWAIYSANKIILELALGASLLGIYTVATKIPSLINVFISIFQQSWTISSVKEVETTNDSDFYTDVFNAVSLVAFGMSIGIILVIKPFMNIYVGSEFVEAWKYVPLLLAGATFSAVSSYFVTLYAALKKSLNNMLTTLIPAALNIGLTLLLVNSMGIWAAVIGMASSYFVMALVRMIDVTRYIKIKIDTMRFALNSLILIAEAILVSMEISIYLVSAIAVILFVAINFKYLKRISLAIFKKKA